ncbi:MAG TPA: hypothetical protein DHN29_20745 [Cytophagales bacterium]|nr:hypothetical protein [Cytophagales bacterium]
MEYEEIEERWEDAQEFDVGDCVLASTIRGFVGLVARVWFDGQLECWQYKVLWNDGDETTEDYESELILAKDWKEER